MAFFVVCMLNTKFYISKVKTPPPNTTTTTKGKLKRSYGSPEKQHRISKHFMGKDNPINTYFASFVF